MPDKIKIALATINPTVGDISGNIDLILAARKEAKHADIVVYSELVLIGYPPEDLVLKPALQRRAMDAVIELAGTTMDGGPAMLIGSCWREGGELYNSAILIDEGKIKAIRHKVDLPNYGVFDEKRIFKAGSFEDVINFRGVKLGVLICEDMWTEDYSDHLRNKGAEILVVLNGSPYEVNKTHLRLSLAKQRCGEAKIPLIYVNQIGGQDELVFDGSTFVLNANGTLSYKLKAWRSAVDITLWHKQKSGWICDQSAVDDFNEKFENYYHAMILGLRDYCRKNYFKSIVIGMSGGIDSALSAAVAVDAIGADNVALVMMPSKYTSEESLLDAADCAALLGVKIDNISIVPAVKAFDQMLLPAFAGMVADLTEENLQSRIRGVLLMALSNKRGHLLLTTGNKSEMSVGYATLYGDMCGGFSVLKDIYKMELFELCRWRNAHYPEGGLAPKGRIIPENIIDKPPSAELRPDQRDDDSLPPYDILDDILECLIEKEMHFSDIVKKGHDVKIVAKIEHLLYIAEYKRRQAPPGVKLTGKNFGRDRRYPITNGFRDGRKEEI